MKKLTPEQYMACGRLDRGNPPRDFVAVTHKQDKAVLSKMPRDLLEIKKEGRQTLFRITPTGMAVYLETRKFIKEGKE